MSAWVELALFAAKATIIVVALGSLVPALLLILARTRTTDGDDWAGALVVTRLNDQYDRAAQSLTDALTDNSTARKKRRKRRKPTVSLLPTSPPIYVTDFDGDMTASAVTGLRRVVNAILHGSHEPTEVIVRVKSPGGTVPGYGLAASQLARLRTAGHRVIACVDTIAASGGYMVASVADEIVAAPFAIVGSIGVYLPVPNVNRALKERGVEFQELTSGRYKRTVTFLGEQTDEGITKTQRQLDKTHGLFKDHIVRYRPQIDIDTVSTGEYWYGTQALELGLVDRVLTSDDVIAERVAERTVLYVCAPAERGLRRTISELFAIADRSRSGPQGPTIGA